MKGVRLLTNSMIAMLYLLGLHLVRVGIEIVGLRRLSPWVGVIGIVAGVGVWIIVALVAGMLRNSPSREVVKNER